MATKPILFSGPMVRAILAGDKTQTRRVIKLDIGNDNRFPIGLNTVMNIRDPQAIEYATYKKDDILWVRETWREWDSGLCGCGGDICHCPPDGTPIFRAEINHNMTEEEFKPWRPSIFMPKKYCRIFLKIKNVRSEWLRDITWQDAQEEGFSDYGDNPNQGHRHDPRGWFRDLWNSINAKRGFGWDVSPWVWVYEFERTDKPANWPTN